MCGIVGLTGPATDASLNRVNDSLVHRGPDDSGEFRDPEARVALAMRRLSILDLGGGHQPMSNEEQSIWIVFNGEIYNSPELRVQLEAKGHRFSTSHSDTECLLHLYEEEGPEMLSELNGMFAFVILDRRRKRLFGARDRFGIKPLYYARPGGEFAFASELKSLLLLPGISRDLNLQSFCHYLSLRYVPGSESIFRDIRRLLPAHCFTYDLEKKDLKISRYWALNPAETEDRPEEEWAELVRAQLGAAVKRWTLSDVPVGCSLSGGIDSGAVVGLLAQTGASPIRTYSLGFRGRGEEGWDETRLARKVSDKWGTQHRELILTPDELLEDLVPMVWHLDEPYGGGLPSWYVFRFMAQDVKVGLTGSGGDELFGNYGKWRRYEQSLPTHLPKVKDRARRLASKLPEALLGQQRKERLTKRFQSFVRPIDSYFLYFQDDVKYELLAGQVEGSWTGTADYLQDLYESSGATDMRNGVALVDMQTQLPEEFLLMTDRFSMAHSLEARVPFLDHRFAEQVFRIPAGIRTRPADLKYLLKQAIGDLLPEELLHTEKQGFVIPDTLWLRGKLRPLAECLLSPDRLKQQGLLKPEVYGRTVSPHLEGKADHTAQVWTLLMFQLWHKVFIEEASTDCPAWTWKDII